MQYVLMLAVYTALGGQFDRPAKAHATFPDLASCTAEATRIESRADIGWKYIASCVAVPVPVLANKTEPECSAFVQGFRAFFGRRC